MRPYIFKLMDAARDETARFSTWVKARGLAADDWITLSGRDSNGDKHGGARVLLDDEGKIVYGLGGGQKGATLGNALANLSLERSFSASAKRHERATKKYPVLKGVSPSRYETAGKVDPQKVERIKERATIFKALSAPGMGASLGYSGRLAVNKETLQKMTGWNEEKFNRVTSEMRKEGLLQYSQGNRTGMFHGGKGHEFRFVLPKSTRNLERGEYGDLKRAALNI